MRLLVDGRPYGGGDGEKVFSNAGSGEVRASWKVELPTGKHLLTIKAANGVSNALTDPVEVLIGESTAKQLKGGSGTLYVVAIGINTYPGALQLTCAAPAARSITEAFRQHSKKLFQKIESRLVLDKDATRANIARGLAAQGKGVPETSPWLRQSWQLWRAGKFFLLPVDVDIRNLATTGIAVDTRSVCVPCSTLCFSTPATRQLRRQEEKRPALPTRDNAVRTSRRGAGSDVRASRSKRRRENGHGYFTRALVEGRRQGSARRCLVDLSALQLMSSERTEAIRRRAVPDREPAVYDPGFPRQALSGSPQRPCSGSLSHHVGNAGV